MSNAESCLTDDESEILVYVEFEGYADSSTFRNEKLKLDIVGIDSDHPIMQINGKFYEGTYQDAVGTYMFFEKDESPIVDDPVFDTPATLKYVAKTRKLLKMERVFAMQRTEVLGDSDHAYCIPNMDTIKEAGIPPKYQEDALRFWTNMRDDRMQALTTYLEKQQIREEKRLKGIELDSESDDDNPFAMYKPKKSKEAENITTQPESDIRESHKSEDIDESEETDISNILNRVMELDFSIETSQKASEKPVKKLTVIDPGPSTSRHSDSDTPSFGFKKKHNRAARVVAKTKAKDVFKKPNKRAPKSKKSLQNPSISQEVEKSNETDFSDIKTDNESKHSQEVGESSESDITGKTARGEDNKVQHIDDEILSDKTVCPLTKKLEKQARREAKMKEISERLKTQKLLKIKNTNNVAKDSTTKNT